MSYNTGIVKKSPDFATKWDGRPEKLAEIPRFLGPELKTFRITLRRFEGCRTAAEGWARPERGWVSVGVGGGVGWVGNGWQIGKERRGERETVFGFLNPEFWFYEELPPDFAPVFKKPVEKPVEKK